MPRCHRCWTASCSSSPARVVSARRRWPRRSACTPRVRGGARSSWRSASRASLPTLFGVHAHARGVETELAAGPARASRSTPDRALLEWLQALGGRAPGRVLASSGTFAVLRAGAPGAKELVSMVKIWQLARGAQRRRGYDLVVIDAPATGHALGMLRLAARHSARSRGSAPIAGQTRSSQEPARGRPRAPAYVGCRARQRDGGDRDARAAGGPRAPARSQPHGGDRQQPPAAALLRAGDGEPASSDGSARRAGPSGLREGAGEGAHGAGAPRARQRRASAAAAHAAARSTSARAFSTTRWRGFAGAASSVLAGAVRVGPRAGPRRRCGGSPSGSSGPRRLTPGWPRRSMPRRSSSPSSPRQSRRTLTERSRCTRQPTSRSSSRRAALPTALIMRPWAPIRMPF